ncbi:MAG: nuclear transport factor 2 family protein [Mycobacterium sp.]
MVSRIDQLLDKSDVSDTVRRYFLAMDKFDWDTVASLVGEQMTLDADAPGVEPGAVTRAEFVRTLIARNGGFVGTMHLNPDHVVDLDESDADKAHVTAHMWAGHSVGPDPADSFWGYGIYEIDLVRTQGRWRIVALRIQPAGVLAGGGHPADIYARAADQQRAGNSNGDPNINRP